jgi:predicted transcriptional regulator
MTEPTPIQGDLQAQLMSALWRLSAGTVEQLRSALPARYRSAYSTVQTVLNRLAERGLLTRERRGNAIVYRPKISEAAYLSRTIETTLAAASAEARQTVLARLVGTLDDAEVARLQALNRRTRNRGPAR